MSKFIQQPAVFFGRQPLSRTARASFKVNAYFVKNLRIKITNSTQVITGTSLKRPATVFMITYERIPNTIPSAML
jgi:hypothetical protein